jgi:sugar-specific transcriptional regulator TrmB
MEQYLTSALRQLECSPKEIRLYIASYTLGPAKITDLAKKARLQRSTAYLICEQLIKKQLLIDDNNAYGKQLVAASPDTLIRLLETKKRRVSRSAIALTENLETLQQLYGSTDVIPRISTYRGANGLRTARSHILGSTGEILLWTNQASERNIFGKLEHDTFVIERIQKHIPVRVLAVDNAAGRELLSDDTALLRETRLLPVDTEFSAETYIFDQKVVILDFTADIVALIIENSSVQQAQKALFELSWSSVEASAAKGL